ncbi:MAG: DsbA family protein [Myxococcales bacterium]|nr:DsbA family protein [Myxococcales bacterium]
MPAEGFWLDFVSPQSFLEFRQLARTEPKPALRPVSLRALLAELGNAAPPFAPARPDAKDRYLRREVARYAAALGIDLREPPGHPLDTTLALRVAIAANDWRVTDALFDAYWSGAKIDDAAVIEQELSGRGIEATPLMTAAARDESLAALSQNLKIAIDAGVFEVPTHIAGGQMQVGLSRDALTVPMGTDAIDFYFDYASPFAYLATTQVPRLIEAGARVSLKPIVLGGLFKALGTANVPLFEMSQAKRDYQLRHLLRSAERFGVPFRFATKFPMNTVKALRLTSLVAPTERLALALAIFDAFWVHDRDISSDDELSAIAHAAGIDAAAVWPKLEQEETKRALREATDGAMARGVFGVPTIVCDSPEQLSRGGGTSELFWGQDQVELVVRSMARRAR